MSLEKEPPQTQPKNLTDPALSWEVELRIANWKELYPKISHRPFPFRVYRSRKHLFEHDKVQTGEVAEIRSVDVEWRVESDILLQFVSHEFVKDHLANMADNVDLLSSYFFSQELNGEVKLICAQRFASLVYLFNVLIHAFDNGNKRTSHCVAASYLADFDAATHNGRIYLPSRVIKVFNAHAYEQAIEEEKVLDFVLNFFLAPDNIHYWVNYIFSGRFVHPSNSANPVHTRLLQESLDDVLAQLQENYAIAAM